MMLVTHVAVSLIAVATVDSLLAASSPEYASRWETRLLLYAYAVLSQLAIDAFGHDWAWVRGRLVPRRNRLHSLPALTAMGLAVAAPMVASGAPPGVAAAALAPPILHWLTDLPTEGGVYLGSRRVRPPVSASYDSPAANMAAVLAAYAGFHALAPEEAALPLTVATAAAAYAFIRVLQRAPRRARA